MMNHDELVAAFAQSVGVEKAEALVTEATDELEIDCADVYSDHEVVDICDTIERASDGYLRVVASEVRAAHQAQRRFDALLDRLSDPIVRVRFEAATPVVTAVNPAFEETFGCDASAVGEPLPALIGTGSSEGELIDPWFRADQDCGVEVHHRTADGERRTFIFRAVVVTRENGTVEGYGIYTDITDRKRRERTLEVQNEQLERFASVVSHDLRSPLSVAQGRVDLALERVEDDAVRRELERAADAQARMEGLIDDLLTLARQGRTVDRPRPVELGSVVREAWAIVSTAGATLDVDGLDGAIEADRSRLRQLFENLFRNAVDHGDGADDLAVRVGWLDDPRGFFVEDDGTGVPPADRERIFEHGFTTASDGTGFGLAIVRAIVDAHGWAISVTEGRDGGARFEVTGVVGADGRSGAGGGSEANG